MAIMLLFKLEEEVILLLFRLVVLVLFKLGEEVVILLVFKLVEGVRLLVLGLVVEPLVEE